MNDLYGIDPRAPTSSRDIADLMRQFEPGDGRFIVDFPRNWACHLLHHAEGLSDLQAMAVAEQWMPGNRHFLVPPPIDLTDGTDWAQSAIHMKEKVAKLIGVTGCAPPLWSLESVLLDRDGFPDARGDHIPRTPQAYAAIARPLLQTSPKIVLVDQFFKLSYWDTQQGRFKRAKRQRDSLKALLTEACKLRRVEIFRIEVSSKAALLNDPAGEQFSADLEQLFEECDASHINYGWDQLDEDPSSEQHPRYLLGQNAGLHFDWGFDTGNSGSKNHVHWMGVKELYPLLEKFNL